MSSFARPLDIYFWPTPNCWKITVFCEENNIPYILKPTNILEGEQFTQEYKQINPFGKVPVITDHDGPGGAPVTIAESGAILLYLSQKIGHNVPALQSLQALQWLFFQVGAVGPMLGQAHHFRSYSPEPIPYAIERYTNEASKIYRILDERLSHAEFLAGNYSIADMAVFPWTLFHKRQGQSKESYPHFARWYDIVKARPAVRRGIDAGKELRSTGPTEDQLRTLFEGVSP
jgi:GSH-dependent disulfide-bond oxidoreductase